MNFYKGVFGGKLDISRFKDFGAPMPEGKENGVMHATLDNGTFSFMASDGMPDRAVVVGDNVHLSLAGDDEATLRKYFEDLSAGGKVDMPLDKQMWGDVFGMLTDKYGFHWMVNITMPGSMTDKPAE